MMRPASGTERRGGRQFDSQRMLLPGLFRAPQDFGRISINFHRITLIELIFSSPLSPAYVRRAGQVMSGSMILLSSSIPPHLSIPCHGVAIKSPAPYPVAGDPNQPSAVRQNPPASLSTAGGHRRLLGHLQIPFPYFNVDLFNQILRFCFDLTKQSGPFFPFSQEIICNIERR